MTTELFESGRATADASGVARITLQPLTAFEKWRVSSMTVSSNSSPEVPTVKVYKGGETPSALIDGSYTGTQDRSETNLTLHSGQPLLAVFTGAQIGSTCVFTITGERVRG